MARAAAEQAARASKRVVWREGKLLRIELPGPAFGLAQMLLDPYLVFFDAFADHADAFGDGAEAAARARPLFVAPVVDEFLKRHAEALPGRAPVLAAVPRRWIRPLMRAGVGFRGGDLIEFDPARGQSGDEAAIVEDLDAVRDRALIESHELTNLRGPPELAERLLACRAAGRNVDWLKDRVFGPP